MKQVAYKVNQHILSDPDNHPEQLCVGVTPDIIRTRFRFGVEQDLVPIQGGTCLGTHGV